MNEKQIEKIIQSMEKLMHGHNYEAFFSFHIFKNDLDDKILDSKIQQIFPEFALGSSCKTLISIEECWKKINYGLMYRGDEAAGLYLTAEQEKLLENFQNIYKQFIKSFIKPDTLIYHSDNYPGIFWRYSILLKNPDRSLHIAGGAED